MSETVVENTPAPADAPPSEPIHEPVHNEHDAEGDLEDDEECWDTVSESESEHEAGGDSVPLPQRCVLNFLLICAHFHSCLHFGPRTCNCHTHFYFFN